MLKEKIMDEEMTMLPAYLGALAYLVVQLRGPLRLIAAVICLTAFATAGMGLYLRRKHQPLSSLPNMPAKIIPFPTTKRQDRSAA